MEYYSMLLSLMKYFLEDKEAVMMLILNAFTKFDKTQFHFMIFAF